MLNTFMLNQIVLNGAIGGSSGAVVQPVTPTISLRVFGKAETINLFGDARSLSMHGNVKSPEIEGKVK